VNFNTWFSAAWTACKAESGADGGIAGLAQGEFTEQSIANKASASRNTELQPTELFENASI
jgi:hypothetical protein